MEQDPGSALAQFVRSGGPEALDDPRRVRAVLRDAAPSAHLEVSLLVAALEEGVGQRLARSSASLVGGEIDRLSSELVQRRGFAPDHAAWAVRTLAWALGRAPQPAPRGGATPVPGYGTGGHQGPPSEPQVPGGGWGGPGPADWSWAPAGGGPVGGGPVGGGPVGGGPVGGSTASGSGGGEGDRRRIIVIAAAAAVAVVIVGVVLFVSGVFGGSGSAGDTAAGGTSAGPSGEDGGTDEAGDTSGPTSDGSTDGDDEGDGGGHGDTSTETTSAETTYGTGSYPNAAERELLGHLSEDLTETNACMRWSSPDGNHVFAGTQPSAVISCHPPSGSPPAMTEIVFALYPTQSGAEDLFFSTFHMPDIKGDQCVADWPMWDTYTVEGETEQAGYLGCTVTEPEGPSFVVWTRSGTGVYAFAAGERTALHQLYGWWQNSDAAYIW